MTLAEALPTTGAATAPEAVLRVEGLCVSVRSEAGLRPLVEDLSFTLNRGETLAIAGESGSGKSITSLAIMGLLPPPAVRVTGGRVLLSGQELTSLPEPDLRAIRGDRIAMIFQEPMTCLNPVMTIGAQLTEAIRAHEPVGRSEAAKARDRGAQGRPAVRTRTPYAPVSARTVRRHAPAGDDRHGPRPAPRGADRRRTHDRP
jgi:peptide/nickel transport system ATP-binding protein